MVWWRILVGIELSQRGTFLKADNKKPIAITVPFTPFFFKGFIVFICNVVSDSSGIKVADSNVYKS